VGGTEYPVWLNLRPHAREFLKRISAHFEVIVFTASHGAYADTVVN
jgi:CTD small phosphatase-like protein 2